MIHMQIIPGPSPPPVLPERGISLLLLLCFLHQPAELKGAGTHQLAHSSEAHPHVLEDQLPYLYCLRLQMTAVPFEYAERIFLLKNLGKPKTVKAHLVWFVHSFTLYANKTASLLHCLN